MDVSEVLIVAARVGGILVGAFILERVVRYSISRFVRRLIADQEARDAAREQQEETLEAGAARQYLAPLRLRHRAERSERLTQRAGALGAALRSVASITIYTVAIIMVLGEFDVSLGPLLAGAGIAGVALGFGAQSLVRDFLSGIFILIEDQYGVGDIVDLGEAIGTVEEVTLRVTRVRDVRGTLWHVPNGEIRRVGNQSQLWARVILDVEVAYDTEIAKASAVIKEVADALWREGLATAPILEEPEIWGVENFGPDAIVLRLAAKTEPGLQWALSRELRARLKRAFDEHGIEIPFPQRTVWLHGEGEGVLQGGAPAGGDTEVDDETVDNETADNETADEGGAGDESVDGATTG
ncbi:MAG: mechanosensitive ion channel family protein [Thermoleophilia bacterium]|nr:mechanosensitive ion channel family protein [Thermoleophilia bacterium]